jgi:hypothetical protein
MNWTQHTKTKNKVRRLLVSHLPKHEQKFLIENFACLEACAYIFDSCFDNLTEAYKLCENVSYMAWLADVLGFGFVNVDSPTEMRANLTPEQIKVRLKALRYKYKKGKKR